VKSPSAGTGWAFFLRELAKKILSEREIEILVSLAWATPPPPPGDANLTYDYVK
jgi:hypothetical protein